MLILASATGGGETSYSATVDDGSNTATVDAQRPETGSGSGGSTDLPHDRYYRLDHAFCQVIDQSSSMWGEYAQGNCGDGMVNVEPVIVTCPPDSYQLAPLFVMRVRPDGSYADPEPVSGGQCVTPADLAADAERAFSTMHVPAPPATLQTGDPTQLLVNAWYPVYTSNTPVTQQTVLLDVPVEIRALPAEFTWDFDDPFSTTGPTLTTTDPGRPWQPGDDTPDRHWVAHAWTRLGNPDNAADRAHGTAWDDDADAKYRTDVTVTLTTTWHGQYRITGTPTWTDIPGRLTTTSTAGTYTVTEAPTKLYCDDLTGHDHCTN